MRKRSLLFYVLWAPPWCWGFQMDLVYPWMTHNDLFQGSIINNLNAAPVTVHLTATRQNGNEPESGMREPLFLEPFSQRVLPAELLFPSLVIQTRATSISSCYPYQR